MIDPYVILGLPYRATETEIREAFHRKLSTAPNKEEIIEAYGMISTSVERNRVRFSRMETCLLEPGEVDAQQQIDVTSLIKELAFLSSWEMGDDECLN